MGSSQRDDQFPPLSTPEGHVTTVAPRHERPAEPLDPTLLARMRKVAVDDLADRVGPLYVMDAGIRPMHTTRTAFAGQAVTVKAVPGDNLALFGALSDIRPGDVLIVDWRGFIGSSANGTSMLIGPIVDGLEAVVVDGGTRDVQEAADLGLPLFARAICPTPAIKRDIGEINVPVSCGGVVVHPGDLVVGGAGGVVVVPRADVDRIALTVDAYAAPGDLSGWPVDERKAVSARRVAQHHDALERRRHFLSQFPSH
jgi:4-hydroxy-4-methyl-2-oxoglutarate aldolase